MSQPKFRRFWIPIHRDSQGITRWTYGYDYVPDSQAPDQSLQRFVLLSIVGMYALGVLSGALTTAIIINLLAK